MSAWSTKLALHLVGHIDSTFNASLSCAMAFGWPKSKPSKPKFREGSIHITAPHWILPLSVASCVRWWPETLAWNVQCIFRRVLESNSFAYGGYLDQTNCRSWGKSKLEVTRKERRHVSLTTAKCCMFRYWDLTQDNSAFDETHETFKNLRVCPIIGEGTETLLSSFRQTQYSTSASDATMAISGSPTNWCSWGTGLNPLPTNHPATQKWGFKPGNNYRNPSKTAMAIHLTWNALSFFGGKDFSNPINSTKFPGADQFEVHHEVP